MNRLGRAITWVNNKHDVSPLFRVISFKSFGGISLEISLWKYWWTNIDCFPILSSVISCCPYHISTIVKLLHFEKVPVEPGSLAESWQFMKINIWSNPKTSVQWDRHWQTSSNGESNRSCIYSFLSHTPLCLRFSSLRANGDDLVKSTLHVFNDNGHIDCMTSTYTNYLFYNLLTFFFGSCLDD